MSEKLSIGIDLGTSNSALALATAESEGVEILPITQLASPGTLLEQALLPSALYLPHASEYEESQFSLPWSEVRDSPQVVGVYARERGQDVPERVITSAKSWLCNPRVDRRGAILPWKSEGEFTRLSPLEVSAAFLSHLRESLQSSQALGPDATALEQAEIVLAVPASFDEVARQLTLEAAKDSGWGELTLLEEPLAAFYAWIDGNADTWRKQISAGDVVLVCDVGGGTSDFSLIAVNEAEGELELQRISVGEHILLGGDNMDLALAHQIASSLADQGTELEPWQFQVVSQLVQRAKEKLLEEDAPEEVPLSIPSRGASLFASTIQASLKREDVRTLLVEGFFPLSGRDETPRKASSGLRDVGLPYASDPSLSRHLAAFLQTSSQNVHSSEELLGLVPESLRSDGMIAPTKVLFNGGVFQSKALRERLLEVVQSWNPETRLEPLDGAELNLAVARGAAAYGRLRSSGKGHRVRAGISRSYYIGIESSMPAVPGLEPPLQGLCVLPQGTEEGSEFELEDQEFHLLQGEAVRFRFFSSSVRAGDAAGAFVQNAAKQLDELAALEAAISSEVFPEGSEIPVRVKVVVTELGMLELWMQHLDSGQRWKLELDIRATEAAEVSH